MNVRKSNFFHYIGAFLMAILIHGEHPCLTQNIVNKRTYLKQTRRYYLHD
uniref:Uncharacterized protein n=1 Tax=Nelumbo nucifera TaxID=4432 RepID=A0A822XMH8_NELNU|nr:TPA_asm: hypothetical protein HUJ06_021619 [Nelumbo nucifera]